RLHAVDGSVELFLIEAAQLMVKRLLQHGVEEAPERARSAHAVFPHARLALMNTERDGIAKRCAEIAGVESLVVQPVAAFVDATEQAGLEVVFVHTCRDTNVCRVE